MHCLRIGTSIGHGEKSWLGVLACKVLIGELLTVDGLAASTLFKCELPVRVYWCWRTYVAASEVTTLKHELRDDAVECGARVTETLLTSAEGAEVLSGLWDYIVVKDEVDSAGLFCDGRS